MRCYSKPLWIFFRALGVPTGDKAAVAYGVPAWLKQQRKIVQKEFLAAYFGSEMTKPVVDKRNGKVFLQPAFSLNKTLLLVPSGVSFAAELEEMLRGFAVNVSQTKIVDGVVRKSGWKTKKIKVLFDCNLENLAALYGTIGFQYCAERKSLARLAFSYIQTKQYEIQKMKEALQTAVALCKNGASRKGILQTLNFEVREHDIANWAKKAKKGKIVSPRVPEIDFPSFGQWIREHALNENGLTWETIETIQSVPCSDVRDVTTVQAYHNFFANGFLTGNCGLVKNLALLAEVTTEVEEEPIEKALYRMGVKLKK
jgi:intein/homing endonuclease